MPDVSKSHNVFLFKGPDSSLTTIELPRQPESSTKPLEKPKPRIVISQSTEIIGVCRLVAATTNLAGEH